MNDNDPIFKPSHYNATVREDAKAGIRVVVVTATDLDTAAVQKPITYTLASETKGYFEIDVTSGLITTGKFGLL